MPAHSAKPDMPDVTDAHRKAAFCAMRWAGWTFDAAMADPVRAKVIECRAHHIRTAEWVATAQRTVVPVTRVRPGLDGHPLRWCTQLAPGPLEAVGQQKTQQLFQPTSPRSFGFTK
jgi:hypothetical protein